MDALDAETNGAEWWIISNSFWSDFEMYVYSYFFLILCSRNSCHTNRETTFFRTKRSGSAVKVPNFPCYGIFSKTLTSYFEKMQGSQMFCASESPKAYVNAEIRRWVTQGNSI
jgi:hypothetical protein